MAISSIISFGFGNGTFSPGVAKLPTLGYSQAIPPTPTDGIVLCNVVGHIATARLIGSIGSVEATGYIGTARATGQGEC